MGMTMAFYRPPVGKSVIDVKVRGGGWTGRMRTGILGGACNHGLVLGSSQSTLKSKYRHFDARGVRLDNGGMGGWEPSQHLGERGVPLDLTLWFQWGRKTMAPWGCDRAGRTSTRSRIGQVICAYPLSKGAKYQAFGACGK
jgi:hypothetical protein